MERYDTLMKLSSNLCHFSRLTSQVPPEPYMPMQKCVVEPGFRSDLPTCWRYLLAVPTTEYFTVLSVGFHSTYTSLPSLKPNSVSRVGLPWA